MIQKSLLIIDNHDSFTYNLVDLVRRFSVPMTVCQVENVSEEMAAQHSHLLISPGPDVPEAYPNLFHIVEKFYRSKTIFGICLGHQMLCQFFGGHLYNLGAVRHGQNGVLRHAGESRFLSVLPPDSTIGLYHSWAVSAEHFPAALQITGYCQDGIIMAMEHRQLPIFGVQFHPESFITTYGDRLFSHWLKEF